MNGSTLAASVVPVAVARRRVESAGPPIGAGRVVPFNVPRIELDRQLAVNRWRRPRFFFPSVVAVDEKFFSISIVSVTCDA